MVELSAPASFLPLPHPLIRRAIAVNKTKKNKTALVNVLLFMALPPQIFINNYHGTSDSFDRRSSDGIYPSRSSNPSGAG
jgi:hypothetical protein